MNSTGPLIDRAVPLEPDEAAIREHAYHLWLQDGRSDGHDLEHWFKARESLRSQAQVKHLDLSRQVPPLRSLRTHRNRRSSRSMRASRL